MAPGEISRSWRWFGFAFGILVPLIVWTYIVATIPYGSTRLNFVFVLAEVACLGWFLRSGAHSPLAAKLMSVWFAIGTMYAVFWSMLGLAGLSMADSSVHRPSSEALLLIALSLSPFPCIPIYFMAAFRALTSARVAPAATRAAG
jgi:hypothetical protein